ncbi:MAG: hypothetical protein L3I99_05150 [Sulfurimonas sp.]|nr:hypothetical protein [Sulfurimonas sp.]
MLVLRKNAIALLMTMMFIVAITFSIGIGLKYTNDAQETLKKENFLLQSNVILEDILNILKTSKELDQAESEAGLFLFLSQASFIPIEYGDIKVALELSSARAKFNPNTLYDFNTTKINKQKVLALKEYMSNNNVNPIYVDILLDGMGGVKEDNSYYSDIFNEKPTLFRDYLTSYEHLQGFNDFYTNSFYDNSLSKIKFEDIFYFTKDKNVSIDLNYATAEVWKLMLNITNDEAKNLVAFAGSYTENNPPVLSSDQNRILQNYKISYFEPYIDVKLEIIKDTLSAKISFEYDIVERKGYNFHYEI